MKALSVLYNAGGRTGVGMLLYMMKTRPDMANAIRELTKCVSDPSPAAYKEMLRVIKFTEIGRASCRERV